MNTYEAPFTTRAEYHEAIIADDYPLQPVQFING